MRLEITSLLLILKPLLPSSNELLFLSFSCTLMLITGRTQPAMHSPMPTLQLKSFFLSHEVSTAELQSFSVNRPTLLKHIMTSNSMSFSSRLRCLQSANMDKQPLL